MLIEDFILAQTKHPIYHSLIRQQPLYFYVHYF